MPYDIRLRAWHVWLPQWVRRTVYARPVRMFIQRGRRGWSDEDLWEFDQYLGRVVAGGLRQLAEVTHGWPGNEDEFPRFEDWQRFLTEIADDLEPWVSDPGRFLDRESFERASAAMRRMARHYGSYWD